VWLSSLFITKLIFEDKQKTNYMNFKIFAFSLLILFLISCKAKMKFDYNGTYNSALNGEGVSIGQLIIKYKENTEIEFEITTATQSGCTGDLKGIAKINSNGIATHNSSNCKSLTFEFKKDQIIVKEENCDVHGMKCFFSGTYQK
jgi:hypothetical protein